MRRVRQTTYLMVAVCFWLGLGSVHGQQLHRNDLGQQVQLFPGQKNVRCEEVEHKATSEYAFRGNGSETISIDAEAAPSTTAPTIHYVYSTPRAPFAGDFSASVWVKSQKKGIRLRVRLVLPRVPNPQKPTEAYFTFIDAEIYENAGNWQRLEVRDTAKLAKEKQQLLRVELNRDVDLSDAYVDELILNVYTGPGRNQIWVDDIEIGPVVEDRPAAGPASSGQTAGGPAALPSKGGLVEVNGNQLLVDGKRLLFRGIRYTDTPLDTLKRAGINLLFLEPGIGDQGVTDAMRHDFHLVPTLAVPELDPSPGPVNVSLTREGDGLSPAATRLLASDRVLFWYLGGGRSFEQIEKVARTASIVRENDAQRPIGADVWDGLWPYSRNVDVLGVHRWPLLTSLELPKYRDWLAQRKALARPGTFTWTWVQTHLPEWYTSLVLERSPASAFDTPIGPQPEQVRLLTYLAIAEGYRGIGYWSDRFLADSHQGRDRLLAVALLNLELQMLEPALLAVNRQPVWIDTSNPNIKAAVLSGDRGMIVLPIWLGAGTQYVPGQAADINLTMTVPMVPPTAQPWEVSPGNVHAIQPKRVPGGVQITIPEFDVATAVVFTSDLTPQGLLVYWQDLHRKLAAQAAQYTIDLADYQRRKVLKVHEQVKSLAQPVVGAEKLVGDADRRLQLARAFYTNQDYRAAYLEAQRALRPMRHLMRLEWEQAVAQGGTPNASPYTLSYYTLPKFWSQQESIKRSTPGANVLASGNFEGEPDPSWAVRQTSLDSVQLQARISTDATHEGRQALELNVVPKPNPTDPGKPIRPPEALERTYLSVTSPTVRIAPGTIVRISGWMRIPRPITASADGALFFDSIGGEPMAVRQCQATDWKQFTLYRKVPASGEVSLTVGLAGLGTVQFDDLRIEPLLPTGRDVMVLQP